MVQHSILKSHKHSKMIEPILSFVFRNDWLKIQRWLSVKSMKPNFEVVVSVLLPLCCYIG